MTVSEVCFQCLKHDFFTVRMINFSYDYLETEPTGIQLLEKSSRSSVFTVSLFHCYPLCVVTKLLNTSKQCSNVDCFAMAIIKHFFFKSYE